MGDTWTYVTPDTKRAKKFRAKDADTTAIRAKWFTDQTTRHPNANQHDQRKEAGSPRPASRMRNFLLLTPWSSIVSWAFLATGLVTYIVNASKLADLSTTLLDAVHFGKNAYNAHLLTFISSYVISGILGLVGILVGGIAAFIHIKHVVNGPFWSGLHRTFLTSTLLLGLLYLAACVAWFVTLMNYTSSWMTGLWDFEQGAMYKAGVLAAEAGDVAGDVCVDACLNLGQFPFFGAEGCVCEAASVAGLASLANTARGKGMWVLVGIVAISIGLIHSVVNVAADMGGTWVVIHAEIVDYSNKEDVGMARGDYDDEAVSGISSAVNTTPATHTKEYVKSRLGSLGAVPGHVPVQHGNYGSASGAVFSSNV